MRRLSMILAGLSMIAEGQLRRASTMLVGLSTVAGG